MASLDRIGNRAVYPELDDRHDASEAVEKGLAALKIKGGAAKKEPKKNEGKEELKAVGALASPAAPPMPAQVAAVVVDAPATAVPTTHKAVGVAKSLLVVKNAHGDDIHGMLQVGAKTFVTGGKDGALRMWNIAGELVREVWQPAKIDYHEWITALAPFGASRWISGTRNGYLDLWGNAGEHIKSLEAKIAASSGAKCKDRNAGRINCLAQCLNADTTSHYYVGRPTLFSTQHTDISAPLNTCITSTNDWVYCITPLTNAKLMVVTGARLDIWTKVTGQHLWKQNALITEARSKAVKAHQRPFISNVTPLDGKPGVYGLAVFGGAVTLMDLNTEKIARTYKEHTQRVWQVENIRPEIFASCSDDHTIKIWDARLAKSAVTLSGSIGRVSTLLRICDTVLISGSCTDDLRATSERAQLTVWDIRSL